MASILDLNPEIRKKIMEATGGQPVGELAGPGEFQGKPLPEIVVEAKKRYPYEGCVSGMCNDMASKYQEAPEEFRKLNNLYGDAWDLLKNSYGQDVPLDKLQEGDVVNLSRDPFASDKERNIPGKNQHVGYVSKVENGTPYVRHYINMGKDDQGKPYGEYFEEPINDVKEKFKYWPTGAKRIDRFKSILLGEPNIKFDQGYAPNDVESGFIKANSQKKNLQNVLKLDSDEYDELAKMAYGIMGAESSFGRSARSAYRMSVPDFIQKMVKVSHDAARGVDVYDENINNLSQGYSSTKESTLHGVSDNLNRNLKPSELAGMVKSGNYEGLDRTNNYLYTVFNKLGISPDNLENGENSAKAVIATLAWMKKRNPNATPDELLKMYTGKKDISNYKSKVETYQKNINKNAADNLQYSKEDEVFGEASVMANKANAALKQVKSDIVSAIRDKAPLPENAKVFLADLLGAKGEITENTLSEKTLKALKKIVESKIESNNFAIGYEDYGTSKNKNEDVGTGSVSLSKMATDQNYKLKSLLGQASVRKGKDGKYYVEDTYDFNDKGKSFGLIDDLKKRGISPYAIFRALGRNFGSEDNQGSKVKIKVKE